MRVALVLASKLGGGYESSFGVRFPPLAAAYLASLAKQAGYSVKFFDASIHRWGPRKLAKEIVDYDPDIVGFILNASSLHRPSVETAKLVKETSDSLIVAGGHHATFVYPLLLRDGFDAVVLHEGEETFSELLRVYKEGGSLHGIKGIAFRDRYGKIVRNPLRDFIWDLDKLPFPMFEIFDKKHYTMGLLDPNGSTITIETSRGCPYNCDYCSVTKMWGGVWRFKSVKRVLEELKRIYELGYKWVFIVDDNFIVPVKKFLEEKIRLLKEIIRKGFNKLRFIIQLRADFVAKNREIANLLYDAGVRIVFLGIESGDPNTLRNMRKNISPDISAKAVKILSDAGIIVHAGFILGAPYEGKEAMNTTLRYAYKLIYYGLDSAQFSIYTPLPGTDAFTRAFKNNSLLTLDWDLYDTLHPVIKTCISPTKLLIKQRLAHYSFFLRKGLKAISSKTLLSKPSREKDLYLHNGTKYMLKKIPSYLLGLLKLPIEVLKLKIRLSKGINSSDLKAIGDAIGFWNEIRIKCLKSRYMSFPISGSK
ncbi:MAG: radical SAM protein [Thermoprotei archaeon]|nr:MAG: radical SAM protein [Thermoprotei archaeon]